MFKKLLKWIIISLVSYYLVMGIFVFAFKKDVSEEYKKSHLVNRFFSTNRGEDRAIVVDSPQDSFKIRVNMIETAEKTLELSYYSMEAGSVTTTTWALLLEAADRGVKVRIILDGIANGVQYKQNEILYAIKNHPNIELKFYELPHFLKPWTINNRLHDKYIIADKKVAIIGGRNISDRFMAPQGYAGEVAYDLDVAIYNRNLNNSVIRDLSRYFEEVYYSEYAVDSIKHLSKKEKVKGKEIATQLRKHLQKERKLRENFFHQTIGWESITFPTNKISLIRNPITRFNKEPWVWYEINQLIHSANRNVFIQSPYIVPSRKMMHSFFDDVTDEGVNVKVLTNSRGTTPNYPAYSVYLNYRERIVDSGVKMYEYQGEHSIHGKAYMIDDELSLIGSFNLDPRSAFLSTETMVVIQGKEIKQQLEAISNNYVEKSLSINGDYDYAVTEESVEERPLSTMKKIGLRVIGFFGRFVEYLL